MFRIFLFLVYMICKVISLAQLNRDEFDTIKEDQTPLQRIKRHNGKIDTYYRWPNKTVPYWINMTYYSKFTDDFLSVKRVADSFPVSFRSSRTLRPNQTGNENSRKRFLYQVCGSHRRKRFHHDNRRCREMLVEDWQTWW